MSLVNDFQFQVNLFLLLFIKASFLITFCLRTTALIKDCVSRKSKVEKSGPKILFLGNLYVNAQAQNKMKIFYREISKKNHLILRILRMKHDLRNMFSRLKDCNKA